MGPFSNPGHTHPGILILESPPLGGSIPVAAARGWWRSESAYSVGRVSGVLSANIGLARCWVVLTFCRHGRSPLTAEAVPAL